MKCGAIYCYDHEKSLAISLPHAVHFSGSGDGHYCKKCVAALEASGGDLLFLSYLRIADLRKESERYYADFKRRADHAEKVCAAEYQKHKKEAP